MSEANIPPNDPTSSESTPSSAAAWFSGWDDFSADPVVEESPDQALPTTQANWQTVDFPNAISADAIERRSLYAQDSSMSWTMQVVPNPSINPPVRVEDIPDLTDQPEVEDLISLIQELNQCNNALLDRVSYLEDALEKSQRQIQISQPGETSKNISSSAALDNATTPEQITQLLNEMEFVRQANKRQEILIETLKGELDNSQERVAHLERDCALIQQRCNEQAQLLTQSENINRDLRTRLQRQQRYTLQFKAALEKCLEVPPPSYTAFAEADSSRVQVPLWYEPQNQLTGQALLPKAQRIQPWSSQSQSKFLEKLNLSSLVNDSLDLQPLPDTVGYESSLNHSLDTNAIAFSAVTQGSGSSIQPTPISYDLKRKDGTTPELGTVRLNQLTDDIDTLADSSDISDISELSPEVLQAGISELQAILGDFWQEQPINSDDVAGEASLWQDLARLIEVSADDLVKASLSNDFSAFETTADLKSVAEPTKASESSAQIEVTAQLTPATGLSSSPIPPLLSRSTESHESTDAKPDPTAKVTTPFGNNPNWPSPLVHPLRPARKLSSLAAVDLPKFGQ